MATASGFLRPPSTSAARQPSAWSIHALRMRLVTTFCSIDAKDGCHQ